MRTSGGGMGGEHQLYVFKFIPIMAGLQFKNGDDLKKPPNASIQVAIRELCDYLDTHNNYDSLSVNLNSTT